MLTYGGDPVTVGMIDLARRRGIPVVFAIHNLGYCKAPPLTDVDARIVASEFARRQALGLLRAREASRLRRHRRAG